MWDNIGKKLQGLAKIICWLGIICSIIYAIVLWSSRLPFLVGLLYLVIGCLLSWIGSWTMYGLGLVVENVENGGSVSTSPANIEKMTTPESSAISQKIEEEPINNSEITQNVKTSANPAWIDDGDSFVLCPQCNKRMTVDFINARKKCPDCGCIYKQ